jgi:pimeloyl-ACP methyl ester carboxylesterase
MNILLIHGNGGSPARFEQAVAEMRRLKPRWHFAVVELSGFGEKELPRSEHYWNVYLADVFRAVEGRTQEQWCLFAQGAGCGILLELAKRGWEFPNGYFLRPKITLLYGGLGFAGERSWFGRMIRMSPFRGCVQWLLQLGFLKKMWSKRFFLSAHTLSEPVVDRFFEDIRQGASFPVIWQLISPDWYEEIRHGAWHQRFHFVWGAHDRIAPPTSLDVWKKDFPKSDFRVVESWGHFPMLDDPGGFAEFVVQQSH